MKPLKWTSGVWVLAIVLGLAAASCAVQVTTDHRPPTASEPDAATKATIQVAYDKLPLHFEANQGQTDEQVHFLSRGRGYTLFLTSTEAVLTLHKSEPKAKGKKEEQEKTVGSTLRLKLVGANPSPQVVGLEELPGKSNYFIGNDPQNWHTNMLTYARVQYQDVYPGIDLIYYGNQRQLEYDFVVAPGADPKVIRLAFDGLVGAGMPPHPIPLVAQPSWLRAGWKPAPLGERGPMPSVFAPSPLAGEACPERSRRGQDGGRSGLPLQMDREKDDLVVYLVTVFPWGESDKKPVSHGASLLLSMLPLASLRVNLLVADRLRVVLLFALS